MSFELAGFQVASDIVVLGVVTGLLYGILAVGLILVYRANRIINFAHGEIGAFGAAVLALAVVEGEWDYWLAFMVAVAVSAAIAAASEILVIRRLRNAPAIMSVIATLGLGQVIFGAAMVANRSVGAGVTFPMPTRMPDLTIGALRVSPAFSAMIILTPLLVIALTVFLRRGRLGIAMRASSANEDAARMAGILTGRMSTLSWAIAGAVAAYTAILILPTRGLATGEFLGPGLLLRALVCAVVARMTNLPVALGIGIGLGVIEQTLLSNYPGAGVVEAAIFGIIIVTLLVQRAGSIRGERKGGWIAVQPWAPLPESFQQVFLIRNLGRLLFGAFVVTSSALLLVISNAAAATLSIILIFAIVGLSLGIITGLGGQLSLGQFAVAAVGATASFSVVNSGWGFLAALLAAGVAGAFVSLVIGLPALRITGLMLAVTTLAFALFAQNWLLRQGWMLGGGVSPARPEIGGIIFDTGRNYFVLTLLVFAFALWLARNIWQGGIGRQLRAVRDNEDVARAFTIPAVRVKLQSFLLAGFFAGIGGALFGHMLSLVSTTAFPIRSSITVAAAAALGGLGLLIGPLLGAIYIVGVPAFLPLDNAGLAATAAGWLLIIMFLPGGIAQGLQPARDRIVNTLARRAGLDPARERAAVPGPEVGETTRGMVLPERTAERAGAGLPVLEAHGITKRYGGVVAVDDVDLTVRAGETLGIIGPNGAGKTTLFEIFSGFTRPDHGTVVFEGADVSRTPAEQRARRGLIRSFQDAVLFPTITVHEAVMLALERTDPTRFTPAMLGLDRAEPRKDARAHEFVAMLGLEPWRNTQLGALSTGTRRITEFACLIALEPKVLLLDEPTAGIAQRESEALAEALERIKAQLALTLVIIEHDMPLLMGVSQRVVAMETGRVIASGTPAEVQADPQVIASYLGADERAIERSQRRELDVLALGLDGAADEADGRSSRGARPRCSALTQAGKRCSRTATHAGLCSQHRRRTAGHVNR